MEKLKQLVLKYKEPILYLFFGGLTTLVSIVSYALCERWLGMDPLVANVISWILAVSFAYVTNRTWVFNSRTKGFRPILREILSFFGGRLATLGLEELILWIGIKRMGMDSLLVKLITQVVVILSNYVISKVFVFRQKKQEESVVDIEDRIC